MYSIFTHIWVILGQMLVNIPAPWILWVVVIFLGIWPIGWNSMGSLWDFMAIHMEKYTQHGIAGVRDWYVANRGW